MKTAFRLSVFAVAVVGVAAAAQFGSQTLELDFRDAAISARTQWSNNDKLTATNAGLGFNGAEPETIYVSIESSQPFAIGYSWRPADAVQIDVEVLPPLRAIRLANGQIYMPFSGSVFARYSPDASHWSSWQIIEARQPAGPTDRQRRFRGRISVPRKERETYESYLEAYGKQDVPWASDEEAAVKWILDRDPLFFSKHLPFMGYVQILFETEIHGGRRLQHISARISYAVDGLASIPKDERAREGRDGPWRFRNQ